SMKPGSEKLPPLCPGSIPTTLPASGLAAAADAVAGASTGRAGGAVKVSAANSEARTWVTSTAANLTVCKARGVKRIVLLDDYQGIALDYGGWDRVPEEWQIVALEQPGADPRPPAGAEAADHHRARQRRDRRRRRPAQRGRRLRHRDQGGADGGADLGADPGAAAQDPHRGRGDAARRLAEHDRRRPRGLHPGPARLRPARPADGPGRPGLRHGGARLESEPRPRRGPRRGSRAGRE